jgi:hypothetical protein
MVSPPHPPQSKPNTPTVHNQIGFMAETFLTPHTLSVLNPLLEPKYNSSIGRAAAWADAYAHTAEGRFSYQWHWIDTHDWPPQTCSLNYTADCAPGGCVVSAIANQTGILRECVARGDEARGNLTCAYALNWIAHFIGDIHQPLHASGRGSGGNFVKVRFGGEEARLHAVCYPFPQFYSSMLTEIGLGRIYPLLRSECQRPLLHPPSRPFLRRLGRQNSQRWLLLGAVYVAEVCGSIDAGEVCRSVGERKQCVRLQLCV